MKPEEASFGVSDDQFHGPHRIGAGVVSSSLLNVTCDDEVVEEDVLQGRVIDGLVVSHGVEHRVHKPHPFPFNFLGRVSTGVVEMHAYPAIILARHLQEFDLLRPQIQYIAVERFVHQDFQLREFVCSRHKKILSLPGEGFSSAPLPQPPMMQIGNTQLAELWRVEQAL